MLRCADNDLITGTGPGTPMGQLFRSYWTPVLLAEELPEEDCPPVRVKVLSERLVAFRDSKGRYGLIDEFCAHRGASLWFGRNEECGLRCPYHGWKYDVTGQCIDLPLEPSEERLCEPINSNRIRLLSRAACYGLIWDCPRRCTSAAAMGILAGARRAAFRVEAPAGMQLAAGT